MKHGYGFYVGQTMNGKPLRTFNVLDDFNREGLGIDVDLSLPSARVQRSLDQIIEERGKPDKYAVTMVLNILQRAWRNWRKERYPT